MKWLLVTLAGLLFLPSGACIFLYRHRYASDRHIANQPD